MKCTFFVLFTILMSTYSILAQISPTPVINNEVRDPNSVKMRSIELERVKRNSNKVSIKDEKELTIKFAEIKKEFEGIQALQASIIKAYTTGKTIGYAKIAHSSLEMTKLAIKLSENLFIQNEPDKKETQEGGKPKTVKVLIIELDSAIGNFVGSPLFSNKKLIDSKTSEKALSDLQNIIELSIRLHNEAKKNF